jgi:hypothetical protein
MPREFGEQTRSISVGEFAGGRGTARPPRHRAMVGGSSITRRSFIQQYKEDLQRHNTMVNAYNSKIQKFEQKYSKYIKKKDGELIFEVSARDPLVSAQLTKQKFKEYSAELTTLQRQGKTLENRQSKLDSTLTNLKKDKFSASVLEQERQQAIIAKKINAVGGSAKFDSFLGGRSSRIVSRFILGTAAGVASETIGATERVGISPERQVVGRPVESAFAAMNIGVPLFRAGRAASRLSKLEKGGIGVVGTVESTGIKGISRIFGNVRSPGAVRDFGAFAASTRVGRATLGGTATLVRKGRKGFRSAKTLSVSMDDLFISKTRNIPKGKIRKTGSTLEAGKVFTVDNVTAVGGRIKVPRTLFTREGNIPFIGKFTKVSSKAENISSGGLKTITKSKGRQRSQFVQLSEQIAETSITKPVKAVPIAKGSLSVKPTKTKPIQIQGVSTGQLQKQTQGLKPIQKVKTKQLSSSATAISLTPMSATAQSTGTGVRSALDLGQSQRLSLKSSSALNLKQSLVSPITPVPTTSLFGIAPPPLFSLPKPTRKGKVSKKKKPIKKRRATFRPTLVGLSMPSVKIKAPSFFTGLETRRRR